MDRCVTADIIRQARKSGQRDAFASGKRFDAACRTISAALRVVPAGPPAASKALTVAKATLGGLLLAARNPAGAMTRLSMVRRPGWGHPMLHRIARGLFAVVIAAGGAPGIRAEDVPTVAAASDLQFALTEVA